MIVDSTPLVPAPSSLPPPTSTKKPKKSSTNSKSKSKSTPSPLAPISQPLPSTSTSTTSANEFLVDPLFNFDFIPQSQPQPQPQSNSDIQVGSTSTASSSSAANIAAHGGYGDFELPVPPPISYQPLPSSSNTLQRGQEDIPVDSPGGGIEGIEGGGGKKKKSKKSKRKEGEEGEGESEKSRRKREKREKKERRKLLELGNQRAQPLSEPQAQLEEIEMQIDPALAGVGETVENQRGKEKDQDKEKKGDKGKGKAVTFNLQEDFGSTSSEGSDGSDGSDSESEVAKQLQKPSSSSTSTTSKPSKTPRRSVSLPISPPRPILVGPIQSSDSTTPANNGSVLDKSKSKSTKKKVFDPTDDGDVVSIEELERDPEYVKPNQRSGTFWETLQTKWTPVKELKALAEEYGTSLSLLSSLSTVRR